MGKKRERDDDVSDSESSSAEKKKKSKKDKKDSKKKEKKESKKKSKKEKREKHSSIIINISKDDYFRKSNFYRYWLFSEKKNNFENFSSDQNHQMFDEFVNYYNKGRLPELYYQDDLPEELLQTIKTKHQWGLKLTKNEKDQVDKGTEFKHTLPSGSSLSASSVSMSMSLKREKEMANVLFEELVPKETGRVERKRHIGPSSSRGDDDFVVPESILLGGGDDFTAAKSSRDQHQHLGKKKDNERLRELESKEKERMANFMRQMGVVTGGMVSEKIIIQPRLPP